MDAELKARFAAITGQAHALDDTDTLAIHGHEPRGLWSGTAALVLKPGSTAEVSAILKLASQTATPVVPQGGNTGLVGGQMPDQSGRAVISSTARLNRVRELDVASGTITVDLSSSMLQTTGTLTGNITSLVTSNRSAGRSATLRIINGGTNRTITYSASWRWVGTKPASGFTLDANKVGILTLTAFGTNETDIIAAWAVEP